MELKEGKPTFYASSRKDWRKWLAANCESEDAVWLIIYKKDSDIDSVYYSEAVDEALCFGWIDSKPNKRDDKSYYQYFSKRKNKSNWSKVNKNKVKELLAKNLMAKRGLKMIEIAKANGTWNALDKVDALIEPDDLLEEFSSNEKAFANWKNFPPSTRRGILEWIFNAKRATTRSKRINETVSLAEQNIRANQFRKKK